MSWYKENTETLYEILETSDQGLNAHEVSIRLKKYGENQLAIKKDSIWKVILEPFRNVLVAVLLAAIVISVLSDELLDNASVEKFEETQYSRSGCHQRW